MRTITERDLVGNAERVGAHLRTRLEALREAGLPVSAVRGRGLMLAVVLGDDLAPQVARACLTTGVVINAIGQRVLRLVPPLILTETQADEAVRRIEAGMRMVLAERSA
jgi:acetylornithine/succinyldiaminopimelate/putrescine aminotransferase